MASYTDASAIASWLGTTLTPEQEAEAELAASAITAWIDHTTGRTWQDADQATEAEYADVFGGTVWLQNRPVTAITTVETRVAGAGQGSLWVVLDPAEYFLADPSAGRVELPGVATDTEARIAYAHAVSSAPADIAFAAKVLAADLLFPTLHPESAGLESLALGQNDISMKYAGASGGEKSATVSGALAVVDSYRRVVLA